MKKPNAVVAGDEVAPVVQDQRFLKKYPLLHSYLFDVVWDDGASRETSAISLFADDGRWKAALNDRAMKRSAYVAGEGLEDVLQQLEAGLLKDSLDWRLWGKNTRKKA